MGISTQRVKLDINKQASMQVIRLGQGDKNGTTLIAELYDGGSPYSLSGKTARFTMRTPDGRSSYSVASSSTSNNTATFNIDERYAAGVAGVTDVAYVEVLSGSTVICSTSRMRVICLQSATEGVSPSQMHDNGLDAAIAAANTAASSANTAASNANTKASRAETATTNANTARDNANSAASAANTAASAATTAAGSANTAASAANSAKDAANTAATSANTAADSANAATSEANAAIEAIGDISELAVPEMTSSVRGGAKVGGSTQVIGGKLEVKLSESATGTSITTGSTSALRELQVNGKSVQDGTPTLDAPVPVQVVEGPLSMVIGNTSVAINLQGNTLASLPDGTRDKLHVDSAGRVWIEKRTGRILTPTDISNVSNLTQITDGARWNIDVDGLASEEIPNGSTNGYCSHTPFSRTFALGSLGSHVFTFGGKVYYVIEGDFTASTAVTWVNSHQMTIIYPLATTQTIDLGYIDPPAIPSGSVVTISASLTPTFDLACWTEHASELADMTAELANEISSLRAQIAALATS
jgi:uncharacterized phage infection (PIP) family protein YhgE